MFFRWIFPATAAIYWTSVRIYHVKKVILVIIVSIYILGIVLSVFVRQSVAGAFTGLSDASILHVPMFLGLAILLGVLFWQLGIRHYHALAIGCSLVMACISEGIELLFSHATFHDLTLNFAGVGLYSVFAFLYTTFDAIHQKGAA
jgi:hypothetical protein